MKVIQFFAISMATLAIQTTAVWATPTAPAHPVMPSSYIVTGYQLWASLSTDCSSPVKVIDNGTSGKDIDVATSTDFGAGTLPSDGTYKCIIIVASDTNKIVPTSTGTDTSGGDANTGNNLCVGGTTYTQDTCTSGTYTLPDGTSTTCTSGVSDKVPTYFSTTGVAGADGHTVATAKLLNTSITVAGASISKTFYVSMPDGVSNTGTSSICGMDSNTGVAFK